jgi:hypothetical protein
LNWSSEAASIHDEAVGSLHHASKSLTKDEQSRTMSSALLVQPKEAALRPREAGGGTEDQVRLSGVDPTRKLMRRLRISVIEVDRTHPAGMPSVENDP